MVFANNIAQKPMIFKKMFSSSINLFFYKIFLLTILQKNILIA